MLRRKLRTALKKRVVFFYEGEDQQEHVRYEYMSYLRYRILYRSHQSVFIYEPNEFEVLLRHLREDDVFLDIGADKGFYSLVASDVCKEAHAFEPNAVPLRILRRSIETQDIRNIHTFDFGLFSRNQLAHLKLSRGKVILNKSPDFSIKQTDRGSIDAGDLAFPEIELRVFDEIRSDIGINRVDFIKMDIEGAELHAIRGMRNTISESRPRILLSVHPSKMVPFGHHHLDLLSELRNMGYSYRMISGSTQDLSNRNLMANYTIFASSELESGQMSRDPKSHTLETVKGN